MPDFRVFDRVKVINIPDGSYGQFLGKFGTVTESNVGNQFVRVLIDGTSSGNAGVLFMREEIKHVF